MTVDELTNSMLGAEGGYSNDPADLGGPTNWGITLKEWELFVGRPLVAEDVKNMTRLNAQAYYAWWLGQHGLLGLVDGDVQNFVVNFALNSGVDRAVKGLQDAVGVEQDGDCGPITLAAANSADPKALLKHLVLDRMHHLIHTSMMRVPDTIIQSTQLKFLEGWWARVWREGVKPL